MADVEVEQYLFRVGKVLGDGLPDFQGNQVDIGLVVSGSRLRDGFFKRGFLADDSDFAGKGLDGAGVGDIYLPGRPA